jgi:hypothetical protein
MPELHQIVLPAFVYNAMLCGLITAACWHVVCIGDGVRKRLRNSENR